MHDLFRKLKVQLQNTVVRAVVRRSGASYQVAHLGDRIQPNTEYMQPQGLYYRAPAGAEGLMLSPLGETSNAVLINLGKRSALPGEVAAGEGTRAVDEGEGGLHYLGEFKVFCHRDGDVLLGSTAATDYVALASRVDAYISTLHTVLSSWPVVTADGGAALKVAYNAAFTVAPSSVAATKVKAI